MSELKPSKIRCESCGYEPNIITDVCIKCGGPVVKICGNCGFENEVDKNRCDRCGALLALSPDKKIEIGEKKIIDEKRIEDKKVKKIELEFESITEAIARKDESFRKRSEKQHEKIEKKIADEVESEKKKLENFVSEQKVVNLKTETNIKEKKEKGRSNIFIFGFILLLFISGFYFIFFKKSYSKYELIITAKRYLSALRDEEYDKAYEYLSQNSRAIVNFSDYVKFLKEYYSKTGRWDFKDIDVYYFTPNQSVIKYKLIEKGVEKEDYLNFVKEYGKWRRPFVYNLFEEIDDAFLKKDFPKALFLSQRLYLIDPLDPRASGYLCWSEYFMHIYDKAIESCKRVVELSNIYPIKYYTDSELFWYTFNYADSLRFVGRIEQSIEVYDTLDRTPGIESVQRCTIHLTRSDSYAALKKYDKTYDDIKKAVDICNDGSLEKKEALRRLQILEGKMCEDAVMFAKKFKYQGSAFEDFLKKAVADAGVVKYEIDFNCQYKQGPVYLIDVKVRKSKRVIKNYSIEVDLWERNATIKEEQ